MKNVIKRRTLLAGAASLGIPELGAMPGRERPSTPRHQGIELGDVQAAPKTAVAAEPFSMVSLSWKPGGRRSHRPAFLIRTRTEDGWTKWFELHDDGHRPDSSAAEHRHARYGTELRLVWPSDAVQVQAEPGERDSPADLQVHLISSVTTSMDRDAEILGNPAYDYTARSLGRPRIYTRADWGADESIRGEPEYGDVLGMFVHHTAGINDYSPEDVPGIIRGIYIDHVKGRGWRDIGYNFLIDKYGRIWEGRDGGITKSVIGAHAQGYNTYSFGAAVLGNYTTKEAEQAVLMAYRDLVTWKFRIHGITPNRQVAYPGQQTRPAISGHRDVSATECPGQRLYDRLPRIRSSVLAAINAPGHRSTRVVKGQPSPRPYSMP